MERRCKSQQQQIFELKQELTNSTAELKLQLAQAEGNTHTHTHTQRTHKVFSSMKPNVTL